MDFPHHHQGCLIHCFDQDQIALLICVTQIRIWVRSRYFINRVWPAWSGQNVAQMTRPSFPTNVHSQRLQTYAFKVVTTYIKQQMVQISIWKDIFKIALYVQLYQYTHAFVIRFVMFFSTFITSEYLLQNYANLQRQQSDIDC